MSKEKENKHNFMFFLIVLIQIVIFIRYFVDRGDFGNKYSALQILTTPTMQMVYFCFYTLMPIVLFGLFISIKKAKALSEKDKKSYKIIYFITVAVLFFILPKDYNNDALNILLNYVCYPLFLIIGFNAASKGFTKVQSNLVSDYPLEFNPENGEKNAFAIKYNGKKNPLVINNVFQGISVSGGAGAGKSATIIDPAIYHSIRAGMSMTLYDFKGNPPTLGLTAYNAWLELPDNFSDEKNNILKKPTFEIFNIHQLQISSRPNPLSPNILKSALDTRSVTDTLMKTLNKEWINKADFWGQAAMALAFAIAERLRKDPDYHPYCTIPHLIELGTSDPMVLIDWLKEDEDICKSIQSFISATNAEQQIAGMMSSFQQPLAQLISDELYYLLGAEPKNQSDLDLNNKDNPRIFSISNDPEKMVALSPVISCLFRTIINKVNAQNKHPHMVSIDEFPTIYIENFSQLPATARSNKIAVQIGIQDFSQVKTQYKDAADEIVSNMGNQFQGMTNNADTARKLSDALGTYQMQKTSYSTSDSSLSMSDSLNNEKILQTRDIMGQDIGNFTGKIAGGEPGFYTDKFEYFDKEKIFKNYKSEIDLPIRDEDTKTLYELLDKEQADIAFKQLIIFNKLRIREEAKKILEPYLPIIDQD